MKWLTPSLLAVMVAFAAMPASADPDRDESGHGRKSERRVHQGGEYKEEYRDGNCKVERKWERNGGYKEETKCKGPRGPAPRTDHERPRGAGVIVTPPSVVIQPPTVVIEGAPIRVR